MSRRTDGGRHREPDGPHRSVPTQRDDPWAADAWEGPAGWDDGWDDAWDDEPPGAPDDGEEDGYVTDSREGRAPAGPHAVGHGAYVDDRWDLTEEQAVATGPVVGWEAPTGHRPVHERPGPPAAAVSATAATAVHQAVGPAAGERAAEAAGDQSRAVHGTGPNRAATAAEPAVAGTEQRSRTAGARCTRRRRIVSRGGRGRRLAWTVAALAALAAVAVAVVLLVVPAPGRDATAPTGTVAVAAPAPSEAEFGERLVRTDGWTVEIDEPRAHEKGEDADVDLPSGTARAVVVEVVLTNTGAEARDTAGWTVKAIVGSTPVEVLPEGAAPSRTVRPGASLTFPVTVPMPKAESDLQLEAAPGGGAPSLFVGTA
ncbi:hypothetical protein [Pseudonocardia sp.]|uniref:hypothetical protein n=1 Tax=Pseudonocardia sp. TaxID=60912 RepID=UPI003D0C1837